MRFEWLFLPVEYFFRDTKCSIRRRSAAIDRRLQQDFPNLLARHTDVHRRPQVHAKFFFAVQRHHHRHRKHAARLSWQARPRPDLSPCVPRDQFLERLVEFVAVLERGFRTFQTVMDSRVPKFSKGHSVYFLLSESALRLAATTRRTYSSAIPRYFRGSNKRSNSAAESSPAIFGSALKASRKFRLSRTARTHADCTISCASALAIFSASAMLTASA